MSAVAPWHASDAVDRAVYRGAPTACGPFRIQADIRRCCSLCEPTETVLGGAIVVCMHITSRISEIDVGGAACLPLLLDVWRCQDGAASSHVEKTYIYSKTCLVTPSKVLGAIETA